MSIIRSTLVAAAMLGFVSSASLAQTPPETPKSSASSKMADVSNWTSRQWDKAKAEWSKQKEKWADCQSHAQAQNLSGRENWSFLASCMTN